MPVGPGNPEASAAPGGRSERMRLFVALDLPGAVREALVDWQQSVLVGRPALRGVEAAGLHVTLCFLGSRPASELSAITGACLEAITGAGVEAITAPSAGIDPSLAGRPPARSEPVPALALGKALWLPAKRPRVLSVALQDGDHGLAQMHRALALALSAACGYQPDERAFRPHVTVARGRARVRIRPEPLEPPPAMAIEASTVTLYRSHLGSAGARYEPLLRVGLQGIPPR